MTFTDSIQTGFRKYAEFSGRSSRSSFWWWVLFVVLLHAVAQSFGRSVAGLASLVTLVPSVAVTARRLHDINKSGWWQLIEFVPLIGWIVMIVWCVQEPVEPNRYG